MIAAKPAPQKPVSQHLWGAFSGTNRFLDNVVSAVLAVLLLFTGYALWNIWQVYRGAAVDAQIVGYKPDGTNNALSLAELQGINPEVCGWLTIPDTNIDYPLVQGPDNAAYLNRDVYGNFAVSGSIFLDYKNQPDFTDFYTIIYGHHMDGGAMFGDVTNFRQEEYFAARPTGTIFLQNATLPLDILACVDASAYDRMLYTLNYGDAAAQQALLNYIRENAVQYREQTLAPGDVLTALSTCSTASADARTILIAVVRRSGVQTG
ncbi:MAG: class B sortase [Gemmiger sp.]|nr:class B sortase [Gemmiger sp.]